MQPASFLQSPVKVFPHRFPFLEPPFISSHFSFSRCLPHFPKVYPQFACGFCICSMWLWCGGGRGPLCGGQSHCAAALLHGLIVSLVFITNGNDDSGGNAGCCGLFVSFVVLSPLHMPPAWWCARVIHTLFSSVLLFPFSGEGAEPLRSRVFHSNS